MAYLKPGATPPLKGKGSKISPKMMSFVDFYMGEANMVAIEAIKMAGYRGSHATLLRQATNLLRHPLVKVELEKRMGDRRERMEFSADFLLTKLMTIINDDSIKPADQLRAIELAGKSIALWKDRQEISGPDGKAIEMEQKITEEVNDFTSRISRLAESARAGGVSKFPNPGREG